MMRREGFELTAGQPRVITREIDGKIHEPVERLAIDVPEEHVGAVTQLLAGRKGRLDHMVQPLDRLGPDGLPDPGPRPDRPPHRVPHRDPRHRDPPSRLRPLGAVGRRAAHPARPARSSPTAAARAPATRCISLQDRGTLFVGPGEEVYEGMIVGENSRSDDLDVNAIKEKQQTNMRAASADVLVRLSPPKRLSLEAALEFLRDDECVEITPDTVRLRKVELDKVRRQKAAAPGLPPRRPPP